MFFSKAFHAHFEFISVRRFKHFLTNAVVAFQKRQCIKVIYVVYTYNIPVLIRPDLPFFGTPMKRFRTSLNGKLISFLEQSLLLID